jgi:nickel-dependent lactate racemase
MSGVTFAVDVTLDPGKRITGVFAGELFAEHAAACAATKRAAMRRVPAPFDVVLTSNSGYPLDQNLYQAVKGMSAAAQIVRDGGVIVTAAECRDGIPAHGPFGRLLAARPSPAGLLAMVGEPGFAEQDGWQVQVQAQIQRRAEVRVKASGLSAEAVRAAHLTPVDDLTRAVREALQAAGPASTLCVLPHGPQTIPYLA